MYKNIHDCTNIVSRRKNRMGSSIYFTGRDDQNVIKECLDKHMFCDKIFIFTKEMENKRSGFYQNFEYQADFVYDPLSAILQTDDMSEYISKMAETITLNMPQAVFYEPEFQRGVRFLIFCVTAHAFLRRLIGDETSYTKSLKDAKNIINNPLFCNEIPVSMGDFTKLLEDAEGLKDAFLLLPEKVKRNIYLSLETFLVNISDTFTIYNKDNLFFVKSGDTSSDFWAALSCIEALQEINNDNYFIFDMPSFRVANFLSYTKNCYCNFTVIAEDIEQIRHIYQSGVEKLFDRVSVVKIFHSIDRISLSFLDYFYHTKDKLSVGSSENTKWDADSLENYIEHSAPVIITEDGFLLTNIQNEREVS